MKKYLLLAAIATVALTTIGCKSDAKEVTKQEKIIDTIPVTTRTLTSANFIEYGSYYGKVNAHKTATLISTVGGRVTSIKAKEGDKVKAGISLARIDADKAQALLDVSRLNEKVTKEQYDRTKKQFKKQNISKVMVDNAHLAWLNSKKSLIDARKMWRGALAVPPIRGIVTTRYVELNDELPPGRPTFTVSQIHKLKIKVGIPESEIVGVAEGNPAKVTFDIYPNREWDGKISRLSREVTAGSRTFLAEITIDNKDRTLKPGLTAKTEIMRQKLEDRIIVPTEVIVTRGANNFIMVAQNGVAQKKAITLGAANETETIITSGIALGEKIILEGSQMVTDGTPIKIQAIN